VGGVGGVGCEDLPTPPYGHPSEEGISNSNLQLKYREERMPLQASTQEIHSQGSLRGGDPPPQRGVWGSEPPDPGSAPTKNICTPQVSTVYRYA
jgi:hypothetical protein